LEVGKKWFYGEVRKGYRLSLCSGMETKRERDLLDLEKTKGKMDEVFSAHNVDSWVLANKVVGGHCRPDNTSIRMLVPLRLHRRQLHVLQPSKGGERRKYGGTMSLGLKRGSLVRHPKHGVCYVGGTKEFKIKAGSEDRLSLHDIGTGERLCQNAKKEKVGFLAFNSWRWRETRRKGGRQFLPTAEAGGILAVER
jgi:hypothetical protein